MPRTACLVFALLTAAMSPAQTTAPTPAPTLHTSMALTYNAAIANLTTTNRFAFQGGAAEADSVGRHGFGAAVNFVGLHTSNGGQANAAPINLIVFAAGPRYERTSGKLTLFAQGLFGFAHGLASVFPSESGPMTRANSIAAQAGGGLDLALNHHLSLRVLQLDWLHTQLPNGALNQQNSLRIGTGVVLH